MNAPCVAPTPVAAIVRPDTSRKRLLLVEPYFVLRRTVASVAAGMGVAEVVEAATVEAGLDKLLSMRFDGAVIALGDDDTAGLDLVRSLRAGRTLSVPACPVAVMTERCDAAAVQTYKSLDVKRVMLKPFKVKAILDTLSVLCAP